MEGVARGRILVVDDEAALRTYLSDTLTRAGHRVETTSEGASALQLLCASPLEVDLLVVDVAMPHMSGFELLDQLRARKATAHLPALILSGYDDREHKVTGLRLGANDYMVKPIDPDELVARVDAHLRVSRELEMWRRQTRFDALTGLLNRHGLTEVVDAEIDRSLRHHADLSLAFFDLDGFKAINDRYGHRVGDDVLCEVSRVLRTSLRTCDVAARWGGDEFVAAFPQANRVAAQLAVDRVRERVEGLSDREKNIGISVGIACLVPEEAGARSRRAERLIDAADHAMYRDKVARARRRRMLRPVNGGKRWRA